MYLAKQYDETRVVTNDKVKIDSFRMKYEKLDLKTKEKTSLKIVNYFKEGKNFYTPISVQRNKQFKAQYMSMSQDYLAYGSFMLLEPAKDSNQLIAVDYFYRTSPSISADQNVNKVGFSFGYRQKDKIVVTIHLPQLFQNNIYEITSENQVEMSFVESLVDSRQISTV